MRSFRFSLAARLFLSAAAIIVGLARSAGATTLVDPVSPAWAGGANTTYQAWDVMIPGSAAAAAPTSTTPVAAETYTNPNGTPQWYDAAAPGDGDFNVGGDAYSFSGVLNPVAVVPGYNIVNNQLNVFAEVQWYGGSVYSSNVLTATYTDPSGTVHANVPVSSLPGYSYNEVYNVDDGNNGFGETYTGDDVWQFTLPQDTSNLQLSWSWGQVSSGLQDISIYTQSAAPVPEPGSLMLAGLGSLGLIAMRFRRADWRAMQPIRD